MSRRPGARFPSVTAVAEATPAAAPRDDAAPRSALRRRMTSRRVGVALLASVIGSAGLASCASGNDALTNLARTTTNSVAGSVGSITLRNVYVAGPVSQGDSAPIVSAFFNGGGEPDTLVSVSSPEAGGGQPPKSAQLAPGGGQIFIADADAPTLRGVQRNLLIGSQLPITFTFAKAGSVTLDVPVEPAAPGASGAPTEATTSTQTPATGSASPSAGASLSAHTATPAAGTATPAAGTPTPTATATATAG
ncbi:hypothetical protein FF36_01118 [Frankia torreyi]|uniref:Copper(I)-binding protein n=1 Tax=Frankia torreyi TaxID=1856 RepID=A0A0D8BJT6_9ACTN|nr:MULTISPECIES: hypothetical protein [Frankia]KJE24391.1 hypothetical protein FF36_01118 [Frankia torreyi]KQC38360.1 hypothetical protein UK82_09925 [Frankia sp. ACN1ag]KQM02318.1 hypothetical protein FF86_10718 [Frankia sp. CpI1-P]